MPVERDEWCRKCAKLGLVSNFVSNDNIQPCDHYGRRNPLTSGCDVTVNLKKVFDESSRAGADLWRYHACPLEQDYGADQEEWKQHGHLMSTPKDSVDETPKDTTNVATKSKEEITKWQRPLHRSSKMQEYPLIYASVGSRVVSAPTSPPSSRPSRCSAGRPSTTPRP
jgi:hypothetical protein